MLNKHIKYIKNNFSSEKCKLVIRTFIRMAQIKRLMLSKADRMWGIWNYILYWGSYKIVKGKKKVVKGFQKHFGNFVICTYNRATNYLLLV